MGGPWSRERECQNATCAGNSTETADDIPCAPSDPNCDPWSSWGPCASPHVPDHICDQIRSKECTEKCSNDIWSEWGAWSHPCSHSCGGYKSRTRYCIKGDCPVNNPGCPGESSQTVDCDHANQGILITAYSQAEIFIPSTKETFQLPAIPGSPRVWHTQTGNVLCGGAYDNTESTCLKLKSNGAGWMPYSPGTVEPRMAHSAWQSPNGVVLMGGYYSGDSTELVNNTDTISQFTLNDPVSYACAINNFGEVVLTGGFGNRKDVVRYSMSGFEGNLPDLNVGRQYHACSRFTDQYGKKYIVGDWRLHRAGEHKIHGDLHSWSHSLGTVRGAATSRLRIELFGFFWFVCV